MIVEFNLTNIIFVVIALFSGAWAMAKMLLEKFEKSQLQFENAQDLRFKALTDLLEKDQAATLQLEREFLKFQSEVPRVYIRRDDWVREAQALLETVRAEVAPIRLSVNRIEDYLIQK
jgi:hypothetical protein